MISKMLVTYSLNQSVTDLPYLVIALILCFLLSELNAQNQKFLTKIKLNIICIIFALTVINIVAKFIVISDFVELDEQRFKAFGFKFDEKTDINYFETLYSDSETLIVSLIYVIFLKYVGKHL